MAKLTGIRKKDSASNTINSLLISYCELGIKKTKMVKKELYEILDSIKKPSGKILNTINEVRELTNKPKTLLDDRTWDELKDQISSKKLTLPYFNMGIFTNNERANKNFISTRHLLFDFDHIVELEVSRKIIENSSTTFCCFLSPSGTGLKVIVKLDGEITSQKQYETVYRHYMKVLENEFGIKPDHTVDCSRTCFISYDPDIYINPSSEIISITGIEEQIQKHNKHTSTDNENLDEFDRIFNGVSEGERTIATTKIVGILIRKRVSKNLISGFLKGWNMRNRPPLDEDELENTVEDLCERYENGDQMGKSDELPSFFIKSDGDIHFINHEFNSYLIDNGFSKYEVGKDVIFLKETDKRIMPKEIHQIRDFVKNNNKYFLRHLMEYDSKMFAKNMLCYLPTTPPIQRLDKKDEAYFFFNNNYFVVRPHKNISVHTYEELPGVIWGAQAQRRNVTLIHDENELSKGEFYRFFMNVCKNDDERISNLKSAIGYLLHGFFDPSNAKAIILMDEEIPMSPDEANGGTGKGIIGKSILYFKGSSAVEVSGKKMTFESPFVFQRLNVDSQILFINDVSANFPFVKLFNGITDGFEVEYKNEKPFMVEGIKVLLSTNYTLNGVGNSFNRRKHEIEFSTHYNESHTPQAEFGHLLFLEWNDEQWNLFDNFMLDCVKYYLENGLAPAKIINGKHRKLITETSNEFFDYYQNGFIKLYQEYNNNDLYLHYYNYSESNPKPSKNAFTRFLSRMARILGWIMKSRRGTGNKYHIIWFVENTVEGVRKPINKLRDENSGIHFPVDFSGENQSTSIDDTTTSKD